MHNPNGLHSLSRRYYPQTAMRVIHRCRLSRRITDCRLRVNRRSQLLKPPTNESQPVLACTILMLRLCCCSACAVSYPVDDNTCMHVCAYMYCLLLVPVPLLPLLFYLHHPKVRVVPARPRPPSLLIRSSTHKSRFSQSSNGKHAGTTKK